MSAPRKMVQLAGAMGYVKVIKCSPWKFRSLLCFQIIFELWAPYTTYTLETWPYSSGMSVWVIVFEKLIHRTIELHMSPLVQLPHLRGEETDRDSSDLSKVPQLVEGPEGELRSLDSCLAHHSFHTPCSTV